MVRHAYRELELHTQKRDDHPRGIDITQRSTVRLTLFDLSVAPIREPDLNPAVGRTRARNARISRYVHRQE